MIQDNSREEKPFKVGQLVLIKPHYRQGLFLVVEYEWDIAFKDWWVWIISQRDGRRSCIGSRHLEAAEETDDQSKQQIQ